MSKVTFVMKPFDWALLAVLSLLWGSSFFWTSIALGPLQAGWIVSARLGLAFVFLTLALLVLKRGFTLSRSAWMALALMGLINNLIPFIFYTLAQHYITSSLAAVLNAFTPLSVLVLSQVFRLEDRMTWFNTIGALLGLAGVAVLMLPGLQGQGWGQAIGVACALIAAVFYGLGSLFARRHKYIDPYLMAWGMVGFAFVYSIPAAFILHGNAPQMPELEIIGALIMLGVFSTALAYMGFFTLLARVGPTNASTVALILPFVAVCLGVVFLGERFTWLSFSASLMIFAGLVFIDGRIPKSVFARMQPNS